MRILTISGSLRTASSNTALLRAAAALAPESMEVVAYEGLDTLPHFNPDLDEGEPPLAVRDLRAQLGAAQGVLISSPEYARGVPGSLKNALDWIVSSGELMGKPVALINTSPAYTGALKAQAALIETLEAMSARVLADATVSIPGVRSKLDARGNVRDPETIRALKAILGALAAAIEAGP